MENTLKKQLVTARNFLKKGKIEEAEAVCLELQASFPESAELLIVSGDICLRKNDPENAESFYRQALSFDAKALWALMGLGDIYRAKGLHHDAIEAYSSALLLKQDLPWAHVCLGDVYAAIDDWDSAFGHYLAADELNDKLLLAKIGLGNSALSLNDAVSAQAYFKKAIALDEHQLNAQLGLARSYIKAEQWQDAQATLEVVRQIAPDHESIETMLKAVTQGINRGRSGEILQAADLAYKTGDFTLAQDLYWQLLDLLPEAAHPLCQLAAMALKDGNSEQALAYYQQASQRQPSYPWAYVGLGDCHGYDLHWSEALECYEKALQLKPDNKYIASLVDHAQEQLQLQKQALPDMIMQADTAFSHHDLDTANELYGEILRLSPGLIHPLCRLGEIAIKRSEADCAVDYYRQAVAIDGNYVWAQLGLGQACVAQGDFSQAKSALRRALSLRSDLLFIEQEFKKAIAGEFLQEAAKALEQEAFDEVYRQMAAALVYDPESPLAYTLLQQLKARQAGDGDGELNEHELELEIHRIYLKGLEQHLERFGCSIPPAIQE